MDILNILYWKCYLMSSVKVNCVDLFFVLLRKTQTCLSESDE